MPPKTKQPKWCDPYVTGLLPLFGFIVGIIMCQITTHMNNYVIDQSAWHCTRFDQGECVRFDRNPLPESQEKTMKNDNR